MLMSRRHNFIFVHIPKTAGRSIRRALRPLACDEPWPLVWLRRLGLRRAPLLPPGLHDHATAAEIEQALDREFFQRAFRFAFVRNPWDRLVSLYHYLRRNPDHDDGRAASLPFDEYVAWTTLTGAHRSQYEFLTDGDGRLMVDFVGRFENLSSDFQSIGEHLGLRTRLSHRNRSQHDRFVAYYTPETWQMVAEAYRRDAELFGYAAAAAASDRPPACGGASLVAGEETGILVRSS